jgi:hypothetical protein
MAGSLHNQLAEAGTRRRDQAQRISRRAQLMEDAMKPTTLVIAAGVVLAGLALGSPVEAQSARITVGVVFGTGPQYPPPPPYAGRGGYGDNRGYGDRRGYGGREYALNRGYNDGYEQGFDAARDRDRFDPRRERWYRDAERGYERDYRMSRNEYRDIYRRGFLDGYDAGYRDAQRGWHGARGGYDGRYNRPPKGGWRW